MTLKLRSLVGSLCFFVAFSGLAQININRPSSSLAEKCQSAILHKQLMLSDPGYAARVVANEATIQQLISSGATMERGGTYTIPVVVHVLHKGEALGTGTNITTAQINSAIANLNDCYGGQGLYPNNIGVQFQLAQRDPFCNATTGIVRVNASGVADYASNGITTANRATVKAFNNWPNTSYYNIWIVSEIDNNGGGSGTQGYAYFPGAGNGTDGAVILYNSFGYDPTGSIGYNLKSYTRHNATTNHELGHAFSLAHTFEGDDADDDGTPDQCPVNTTCAAQGDLCCDTEAHRRDDGDCGATGTTCTGQSIVNIVNNIMAYSSDQCQVVFTDDQEARMVAAITGPRASLLTSMALTPVTGSAPTASQTCSPQTIDLTGDYTIGVFEFTIGSTTYTSGSAFNDGGYHEVWCNNFSLAPNTLYSINVTNGPTYDEKVAVYIDYNNDGDFSDAGENIYTHAVGALTHTGSFTSAASPVTGQSLWVRVISDFEGNTISGPCYIPEYGQVEDFSVVFSGGGCTTPSITGTTPAGRCGTGTVTLGATASAGTLNWYAASSGGSSLGTGTSFVTPSISTTTTYYVDATVSSCTSARTAVIATVNTPSVTGTTPAARCGTGTVTLGATTGAGTLNWYAASSGGSSLGTGTSFVTPSISITTIYYVDATISSCTSARTAVTATVNTTPSITGTTPAGRCGTGTVMLGATASAGTLNWYAASSGGSSLGTGISYTTPSISSTTTYYVDATVGSCVSGRTAVAATVNAAPSGSSTMTPSTCPDNDGAVNLTVSGGVAPFTFLWSNGATTEDITGLAQGGYTVTITGTNGCTGVHSKTVTQNCGTVPNTQLAPSQCGQTLPDLSGSFYCNMVTGAQDYQFEITNVSLGYSQAIARGNSNPNIAKGAFTGLQYGQTYSVRVRAKVAGLWGSYSTVCSIQIGAAGIPTSQLVASQCGQTIADFSGSFNCVAVSGAVDYRFEFVNASLSYNFVINRGNASPNIAKNSVTGLQYNTSYDVRVAAKVGTTWGAYGPVCSITMGPWPTSQMVVSQCNQTMNLLGDFNCTAVAGAQDYQWEFTNPTLGYTKVKVRGSANTNITKAAITGLLNGQTYTVKIKTKIAGAWGNYGPPCTITVNTSMMSPWSSDAREFEQSITDSPIDYKLIAYPNPSGENGFDISIDGLSETGADVSLSIYDINGRPVYSKIFNGQANGNIIKFNADGALSKGIYFVKAEADGKMMSQKVIVK